ncbi:MAG: hypothetical protein V2J02_21120 [Pseudomonadales bacterium]|jgi:hypothetical protein|nr:hypothetical protein [Pseudomonadales bacterium]
MARTVKAQYQIVADDRTRAGFDSAQRRMQDMGAKARALALPVATMGAAFAAAATKAAAMGDAIDKAARVASVSTKRVQELRFAFGQLAGTTSRDVDLALQRFNRRMGLARDGSKEYADALTALGISLDMDTEPALEAVLYRLGQIESDADRAARASKLFGEEAGPKLAAALDGGIQSLDELAAQLNADGGVISDASIQNAVRLNDAMDRLSTQFSGRITDAILEYSDALLPLAEAFGKIAAGAISTVGALSRFGSLIGTGIANLQYGDPTGQNQSPAERVFGPQSGGEPQAPGAIETGRASVSGGPASLPAPFDFSQEDIEAHREMVMEAEAEEHERHAAARERLEADARAHMQRMIEIEERAARQRASIEERLQAQKGAMLEMGLSMAGNVATALTAESKNAALYSLAISKAIGVASVLIDGHRAAGRALAELGPIAGPPVAAKFMASAKMSAGFIAAMGLAEGAAMSVAGGGGSGGGGGGLGGGFGSGQPVTAQNAALGVQERDTNQAALTVRLTVDGSASANGNVIRAMAEGLRAEIEQGDAVIIPPNSLQAASIRSGR